MENNGGNAEEKALKELDLQSPSFMANGREYFIDNQLSAERFYKMQELSYDLGFGSSYEEMFQNLRVLYDLLNEKKFADCAVLTHNMMNGIADLENREMPILKYCACFINYKGEDKRYYTDEMAEAKIKDWTKEGIDFKGFFLLCQRMIGNLQNDYDNTSPSTSPKK